MSFPSYLNHAVSGVEWVGNLPAHWAYQPIKTLASCNDDVLGEATPADYEIEYVEISDVQAGSGIVGSTAFTFGEAPSRARRRLKDGDVLVSTVRTYLRAIAPVHEPPENMIASTGFAVIRPRSVETRYLGYAVQAEFVIGEIISRSVGVSYPAINARDLISIKVPVPTHEEQRFIAAFLDRETRKIDALVDEQRRLIELLKEKRQAVVSHAVTKGLDPSAPMKDSGVEWLGRIPAHWDVSQSRRLFAVYSDPALPDDQMLTASQKYGVIYQSQFIEMEGRRVAEVIMGKENLRHVEPDDFIISMRSFQGGLEWSRLRGSTSFHYVMVRPVKWVHPAFFAQLFKCMPYIQALRATTDLIRDGQELRYSNFVQVPLPVIPQHEQQRIAEYLLSETRRYDALLSESEKFIATLEERRAALISAAVTGKIDVRGLVEVDAEAA